MSDTFTVMEINKTEKINKPEMDIEAIISSLETDITVTTTISSLAVEEVEEEDVEDALSEGEEVTEMAKRCISRSLLIFINTKWLRGQFFKGKFYLTGNAFRVVQTLDQPILEEPNLHQIPVERRFSQLQKFVRFWKVSRAEDQRR